MDANDLKNLRSAVLMIKAFRSEELLDATECFWQCLSYAASTSDLMPLYDRLIYTLHVSNARTRFLEALIGE